MVGPTGGTIVTAGTLTACGGGAVSSRFRLSPTAGEPGGGACGTAETTATIVASEAVGGECMGSTFGSIAVSCCWLGVSFNLIKG